MRTMGALLIGAGIGVLTGLFGVGGGFLITPLLNVVLGIPMPIAVGTGAVQILGVSISGLYQRRAEGRTDYKLAVVLFGGNFVGVRLGAAALTALSGLGTWEIRGAAVAAVDLIVLGIFLVLLGGIAGWLWYDTSRNSQPPAKRVGLFAHVKLPPYTQFDSLEQPTLSIVVISYFGVIIGFLTGLLGIGGGVVMLPALVYLIGMRTHAASATSLALIWLSSFVAVITHASLGNIDLALAIPLLVGGTLGLQVGARLCTRLIGPRIRRYFTFVVLAAMLMVLVKLVTIVT